MTSVSANDSAPDRQQPAPADRTALEGFLRDLYGIAAFFTAHPEIPLPHYVTLSSRVPTRAALDEVAAQLNTHVYGDHQDQTDLDLPSADGRTVNFTVTSRKVSAL